MLSNSLAALDRNHLLHPVSSFRGHEARGSTILAEAEGVMLRDTQGRQYMDGFAGLWCVNAGYGQKSIIEAIRAQLEQLPYATGYFGFGSAPAIRLAARLAELAPGSLNHVYFTLGGSDAVDSALRYIRYHAEATGQPGKTAIISLEHGYHGSSSTGAGVTALPVFHAGFGLPLPHQHTIPSHYAYRNPVGTDPAAIIAASVGALRAKVAELGGPERVAAFFCEPVQGSGGVLVPPEGWLLAMQRTCRALGILFVVDEVITGFGRIGPLFGCAHYGLEPDIVTLAKGLTSGYLPMGAVLLSDALYEAIAAHAGENAIGHGYTYSGHPASAAAALAALDLYIEGGVLDNGRRSGAHLQARLREALGDHPLVGEIRGVSMLAGIEIVSDRNSKALFPAALGMGARLAAAGLDKGVIYRAFANGTIGLAPSLTFLPAEIDELVDRIGGALDTVLDQPEIRAAMAD